MADDAQITEDIIFPTKKELVPFSTLAAMALKKNLSIDFCEFFWEI